MKKLIHTLALQSIKVKLLGLLLFLAGNLQACSDEETASIQVNADVLYFNGTGETQELQIESSGEWTVTVAKGGRMVSLQDERKCTLCPVRIHL